MKNTKKYKNKSNNDFFWENQASVIHRVYIFFWKAVKKVIRTNVCSTLLNWTWFSWNFFRFDNELVDFLVTFKNQRWDKIKSRAHFNFISILLILFFNRLSNVHTSNKSTVVKSLFDPLYLFKVHGVFKEFFNFLVALKICWALGTSFRWIFNVFQEGWCDDSGIYDVMTAYFV